MVFCVVYLCFYCFYILDFNRLTYALIVVSRQISLKCFLLHFFLFAHAKQRYMGFFIAYFIIIIILGRERVFIYLDGLLTFCFSQEYYKP